MLSMIRKALVTGEPRVLTSVPIRTFDLPIWKAHARVAYMSGDAPSQYEAEHTLVEAAGRAASMRRADRPLALALVVLAVMYVVVGVIVGAIGRGGPAGGLALVVVFAIGLAVVVLALVRRRASSRIGSRLYVAGIVTFSLWNAAVIAGSGWLGWWAPRAPGWHFTVSAAVAALPLFVVGGVLLRRSR